MALDWTVDTVPSNELYSEDPTQPGVQTSPATTLTAGPETLCTHLHTGTVAVADAAVSTTVPVDGDPGRRSRICASTLARRSYAETW